MVNYSIFLKRPYKTQLYTDSSPWFCLTRYSKGGNFLQKFGYFTIQGKVQCITCKKKWLGSLCETTMKERSCLLQFTIYVGKSASVPCWPGQAKATNGTFRYSLAITGTYSEQAGIELTPTSCLTPIFDPSAHYRPQVLLSTQNAFIFREVPRRPKP